MSKSIVGKSCTASYGIFGSRWEFLEASKLCTTAEEAVLLATGWASLTERAADRANEEHQDIRFNTKVHYKGFTKKRGITTVS